MRKHRGTYTTTGGQSVSSYWLYEMEWTNKTQQQRWALKMAASAVMGTHRWQTSCVVGTEPRRMGKKSFTRVVLGQEKQKKRGEPGMVQGWWVPGEGRAGALIRAECPDLFGPVENSAPSQYEQDGFCLSKSWKPLVSSLKDQSWWVLHWATQPRYAALSPDSVLSRHSPINSKASFPRFPCYSCSYPPTACLRPAYTTSLPPSLALRPAHTLISIPHVPTSAKAALFRAQLSYSPRLLLVHSFLRDPTGTDALAALLVHRMRSLTRGLLCCCLLHADFLPGLIFKATCSSETPAHFHQTTLRYIPQDRFSIATAVRTSNPNTINRVQSCNISHVKFRPTLFRPFPPTGAKIPFCTFTADNLWRELNSPK
jgi:hypothetical protein